jgi:tetratricopeptide (TPR) repeat protein
MQSNVAVVPENLADPRRAIADLLDRSWKARHTDVAKSHSLAVLAVAFSSNYPDSSLQCRALAHLGNAERMRSQFHEAARILSLAEERACGVPLETRAILWEFWASLYESVRDFSSALRVLRRAEDARASIGDPDGIAKVNISLGVVLGYSGDPLGAIHHLRLAARTAKDISLFRNAVQPLLRFLVEADEATEALSTYWQCERLLDDAPPLFQMKTLWHRGLISLALGTLASAVATFAALRDDYVRRGMAQEAAFVSMDLAMALVRSERGPEALEVLGEVEPLFRVLGIGPEAMASAALRRALASGIESDIRYAADQLAVHSPGEVVIPPAA